jgi:hypothetical protein
VSSLRQRKAEVLRSAQVVLGLEAGGVVVAIHAQTEFEFFELLGIPIAGRMDMFCFGDEADGFVPAYPVLQENLFERREVFAVDDQQFVLVELHFQRDGRVQHRHAGTAVVEQKVFVIVKDALQHGQVDVFPVEVGMALALLLMAAFQDHIDHRPERIEQIQEGIKDSFTGDGGHQDRHINPGLLVPVAIMAVPLAGDHLQIIGRAHGVAEHKLAVPGDPHVGLEFLFAQMFKAACAWRHGPLAKHSAK